MHSIICILVGKEHTIAKDTDFNYICNWLENNKRNLFGYVICYGTNYFDADYFLRYKTDLQ